MKIDIQTINFNATDGLLEDVHSVLNKFTTYNDQVVGADVYLKMMDTHQENTRKVEIKIYLAGNNLYADHQADSFYEALHEAEKKIRVQMQKRQEILQQKH